MTLAYTTVVIRPCRAVCFKIALPPSTGTQNLIHGRVVSRQLGILAAALMPTTDMRGRAILLPFAGILRADRLATMLQDWLLRQTPAGREPQAEGFRPRRCPQAICGCTTPGLLSLTSATTTLDSSDPCHRTTQIMRLAGQCLAGWRLRCRTGVKRAVPLCYNTIRLRLHAAAREAAALLICCTCPNCPRSNLNLA